jgi:hypothetical protein
MDLNFTIHYRSSYETGIQLVNKVALA